MEDYSEYRKTFSGPWWDLGESQLQVSHFLKIEAGASVLFAASLGQNAIESFPNLTFQYSRYLKFIWEVFHLMS